MFVEEYDGQSDALIHFFASHIFSIPFIHFKIPGEGGNVVVVGLLSTKGAAFGPRPQMQGEQFRKHLTPFPLFIQQFEDSWASHSLLQPACFKLTVGLQPPFHVLLHSANLLVESVQTHLYFGVRSHLYVVLVSISSVLKGKRVLFCPLY